MALSEVIDTGRFHSVESDLRLWKAPFNLWEEQRNLWKERLLGTPEKLVAGAEQRVTNFIMLPTRTLLTTEDTENTEGIQKHISPSTIFFASSVLSVSSVVKPFSINI